MTDPLAAYEGDEPYVFVCYSHDDKQAVYAEIRWLQDHGVHVWYDTRGIHPGSEWSDSLARAIDGANRFVYFITPRSVASEYCRRELSYALAEAKPVLAVHLEATDVPGGLRLSLENRQAIHKHKLLGDEFRNALLGTFSPSHTPPTTTSIPAHKTREYQVGLADFVAIGGDPDLASYAAGATLDLRAELLNAGIDVVSRSNADYVIQNFVRRVGDPVRVTAELIRTEDEETLWSEHLDETDDTFTRAPYLARRIESWLTNVNVAQRSATSSQQARDAYFKAREEFSSVVMGGSTHQNAAPRYLKRALDFDPDYYAALVLLANHYMDRLDDRGQVCHVDEANQLVHATLDKAIRLRPGGTGAIWILGTQNVINDLDYPNGIRNLKHVLNQPDFDRTHGVASVRLGWAYQAMNDLDEALIHCESAVALGSVDQAAALVALSNLLAKRGHHKAAVEAMDEALATIGPASPSRGPMLLDSATHSFHLGDIDEARRKVDLAWELDGESRASFFPGVFAMLGDAKRAESILAQTEQRFPNGSASWGRSLNGPTFWAYFYLDRLADAFRWIDIGIDQRGPIALLLDLKNSPVLKDLRADPRFEPAMGRLREIETRGSPTQSIATECYYGPNAQPPSLEPCTQQG